MSFRGGGFELRLEGIGPSGGGLYPWSNRVNEGLELV